MSRPWRASLAAPRSWQASSTPAVSCDASWPPRSSCASSPSCDSIGTPPPSTPTTSSIYWQNYGRMSDLQAKIKARLEEAGHILVTSHIRPDGDAIGSSLGLALGLIDAGKQVQVILSVGLPASFRHLPGADLVRK